MNDAEQPPKVIAFQGEPGAYSHQACRFYRPRMQALPCPTFEDTIEAVHSGRADLAMLPIENSTYGRVADIHHLLPESGLHIIDECFVRVRISLLAVPGTWRVLADLALMAVFSGFYLALFLILVALPAAPSLSYTTSVTSYDPAPGNTWPSGLTPDAPVPSPNAHW